MDTKEDTLEEFETYGAMYKTREEIIEKARLLYAQILNGNINRRRFQPNELKKIYGKSVDMDSLEPMWYYLSGTNAITEYPLHLEKIQTTNYWRLITELEWEDEMRTYGNLRELLQ